MGWGNFRRSVQILEKFKGWGNDWISVILQRGVGWRWICCWWGNESDQPDQSLIEAEEAYWLIRGNGRTTKPSDQWSGMGQIFWISILRWTSAAVLLFPVLALLVHFDTPRKEIGEEDEEDRLGLAKYPPTMCNTEARQMNLGERVEGRKVEGRESVGKDGECACYLSHRPKTTKRQRKGKWGGGGERKRAVGQMGAGREWPTVHNCVAKVIAGQIEPIITPAGCPKDNWDESEVGTKWMVPKRPKFCRNDQRAIVPNAQMAGCIVQTVQENIPNGQQVKWPKRANCWIVPKWANV